MVNALRDFGFVDTIAVSPDALGNAVGQIRCGNDPALDDLGALELTKVSVRRYCDTLPHTKPLFSHDNSPMDYVNSTVLVSLCNLRWIAILCQAMVVIAADWLGVMLPAASLWSAIALLAVFNVYAMFRSRQRTESSPLEVLLHILVDVAALAWLIAWGGGITNPFTSLFLLPIAFAALALPLRWVYVTAAACCLGYACCVLFGKPFPHVHGSISNTFDLHLMGMVVNFLFSVGVVLYFFAKLVQTLRDRERELARLRERFARNEGIVALGIHAASVAHELNTPLGTLTLMLDDVLEQALPDSAKEDLQSMRAVLDVCRDRVRELAAPAGHPDNNLPTMDLQRVMERWLLTRPAIQLVNRTPLSESLPAVEPAIAYLIQALLNNAGDASEAAGKSRIEVDFRSREHALIGEVRDYGNNQDLVAQSLPDQLYASSKPGGLGVGLALGHATVERLGGVLDMQRVEEALGGGLRVRFRLPWPIMHTERDAS